ncbi:MAG: cytochrome c [Acidobacteria bacterium]|nr:cytochrome c [Acidobacteriota bacterium]
MAAKSRPKSRSSKSSGGGGRLIGGIVIGLLIAAAAYLLSTHTPTFQNFFTHRKESNTLSPSKPTSKATKKLTKAMATAAKDAPFSASEDVFEAGAHLYAVNCARCHGIPKHDASEGQSMHPKAVQFWDPHQKDTLSHQTAHEVYGTIAEGDIENGMPAFGNQFSDTEIWQITLLLRSSRLELPDPVLRILTTSGNK